MNWKKLISTRNHKSEKFWIEVTEKLKKIWKSKFEKTELQKIRRWKTLINNTCTSAKLKKHLVIIFSYSTTFRGFLWQNGINPKERDAIYKFFVGMAVCHCSCRILRWVLDFTSARRQKTKCRNLFRDRNAYRRDLLDDNSLQLWVVNGGWTSWFPHNLWPLVNHPIIPGSSVSLSRVASRSSISVLPPPLSHCVSTWRYLFLCWRQNGPPNRINTITVSKFFLHKSVEEIQRKIYNIFRNVAKFFNFTEI